jgi:DHA3 family tetracycline resistance protein-like MFS transporter
MMALAVVMLAVMPEHGFHPVPKGERTTFQHMTGTFREGLRTVQGSRVLVTIILLSAVMGMFSESYDRMQGIHFLNTVGLPGQFSPVVWFGLMSIVAMPVHIFLAEIIRRRINTTSHHAVARTLMALEGLLVVAVLTFAFAGNFWVAAGASIVIGLLRGLGGPLQAAWINQNVESRVRATVFSMHSQANAIGQVVGGPVLGAVGNVSMRLALACGALLLTPNLLLYRRTLRHSDRTQSESTDVPAEA